MEAVIKHTKPLALLTSSMAAKTRRLTVQEQLPEAILGHQRDDIL